MDDLTRINGIGKATAAKLVAAGFDTFEKLAVEGPGLQGVKAEWILEARRILEESTGDATGESLLMTSADGVEWEEIARENSEGTAASGSVLVDAAGAAGDPAVADQPAASAAEPAAAGAAGTPSEDAPPSDQGAGDMPPADVSGMPLALRIEAAAAQLDAQEASFRAAYPHFSAAIDALMARGGGEPRSLRIVSKVEGFRRGGVAHSKAPVEHPIGRFPLAQLEQIFAEPNLSAEFV